MKSYSSYRKYYSEGKLRRKLFALPRQGRDELLEQLMILWTLLSAPETPRAIRLVLVGVLGYLILTVDLCPDFIPIAGWADDVAVIASALSYVHSFVTDSLKEQAKTKLITLKRKKA